MNAKQRAYIQNDACLLFPAFICGFVHSKQDFSIRITSLYWSQPSFVAFACKTATLEPKLQVSMCSRPQLCFFCIQNSDVSTRIASLYWSQHSSVVLSIQNSAFSIRINSLYGSQPSFVAFACKTATLGTELQVTMDPRSHLCFLHSKQRL